MNTYTKINKRTGFTLVEVLVVIAIIGILSTILYVSFQQAREQSRNTAMKASIKEAQLAIETYKAQFGSYPPIDQSVGSSACHSSLGGVRTVSSNCFGADYITGEGSLPPLTPDFINEVPLSDISGNTNCNVIYITEDSSTPNFYKLAAVECAEGVDSGTGTQDDDELAYCPESCGSCPYADSDSEFYESFAVYSLGGQCI